MWIDTDRLRFDDFDPNEPSDGEPMTDEELAALDDEARFEHDRREAMEAYYAELEAVEIDYPF